jgi:hypothetical protein
MYINSQLSTCVGTQSPKYIEMAQGHISLSLAQQSAEAADLRLLYEELKSEAATGRAEAASARTEASSARK